jgi:hypothetical protein
MILTLRWWTPGLDPHQRTSGSSSITQQQSQMDPAMQQFLAAQMQLLQDMSTNMTSMQAQINQNCHIRTSTSSSWAIAHQCFIMQLIHWRQAIGWRQWRSCSPSHSATIERRYCMLQVDFRGQRQLGGMPTLLLMPPLMLSLSRSSPPASGAIIYPPALWS